MSSTFESLGVSEQLVRALVEAGMPTALPIQEMCIPDALAGHDVCGKANTGSGKTLAFGLPMLQNSLKSRPYHPTALVLVPTRELAVQVHEVLSNLTRGTKKRVEVVYGGVSINRQSQSIKRGVDIIVATPGRLIDLIHRRMVDLDQVQMVVLDEADRMADMGFLPQVEEIMDVTNQDRQTMLFSATLDGVINGLVKRYMKNPIRHELPDESPTVDSAVHHFFAVSEADRADVVYMMSTGAERTLVFVKTQHGTDRLAQRLEQKGLSVSVMHGGIRQAARERALARFSQGKSSILVATDVAARGLDVSGLDLVIQFDLPEDHKAYVHRAGRTARAGAKGVVATLVLDHQWREIKRMQKILGINQGIAPARSDDDRLKDIASGSTELIPPPQEHSNDPRSSGEFRPRGRTGYGQGDAKRSSSHGGFQGGSRSRFSSGGASGGSRPAASRSGSRSGGYRGAR